MPASHDPHVRSLVGEPALTTYEPATQSVHAEHALAPTEDQVLLAQATHMAVFEVEEKVPASHDAQMRSAVGEPASATRSPVAQLVHAVHEAALLAVL